ncbi:MAG: hypothetical protein ABIT01_02565, partial [Thermoanaerobaculia bacterium]
GDAASSDRVGLALCELSLELMSGGLLGKAARIPIVADGWRVLLPLYARVLRRDPRRLAGAVTNGLIALAAFTPNGAGEWIRTMAALAPRIEDMDLFLPAGRVAAWRCGVAHLRNAALDAAAALPPELAASILGVKSTLALGALISRLRADSWLDPAFPDQVRTVNVAHEIGAFRGFGGLFVSPPTVSDEDGHLLVFSGERTWELHADRFGATLLPVNAVRPDRPSIRQDCLDSKGNVNLDGRRALIPEIASAASSASSRSILAVTLRYSHAVLVLGAAG